MSWYFHYKDYAVCIRLEEQVCFSIPLFYEGKYTFNWFFSFRSHCCIFLNSYWELKLTTVKKKKKKANIYFSRITMKPRYFLILSWKIHFYTTNKGLESQYIRDNKNQPSEIRCSTVVQKPNSPHQNQSQELELKNFK